MKTFIAIIVLFLSTTLNAQNIYRCYMTDSVMVRETTTTGQNSTQMSYPDNIKYCFGDKKMYHKIDDEKVDDIVEEMDFREGGYIKSEILHYSIDYKDPVRLVLTVFIEVDEYQPTRFTTIYLRKLQY